MGVGMGMGGCYGNGGVVMATWGCYGDGRPLWGAAMGGCYGDGGLPRQQGVSIGGCYGDGGSPWGEGRGISGDGRGCYGDGGTVSSTSCYAKRAGPIRTAQVAIVTDYANQSGAGCYGNGGGAKQSGGNCYGNGSGQSECCELLWKRTGPIRAALVAMGAGTGGSRHGNHPPAAGVAMATGRLKGGSCHSDAASARWPPFWSAILCSLEFSRCHFKPRELRFKG